jgi:SAM-dependent methyltransferase
LINVFPIITLGSLSQEKNLLDKKFIGIGCERSSWKDFVMFDRIASDWKEVRNEAWKPFIALAEPWIMKWIEHNKNPTSDRDFYFLDIGSGTGRHVSFFQQFGKRLIELDASREMIKLDISLSPKIQGSMEFLPFRSHIFDGIFSIASIHHVTPKLARNTVIDDIIRIGLPGSLVIITVWRFFQPKFKKEYINQLSQISFTPGSVKVNQEFGDVLVPWTLKSNRNEKVMRFYHLFRATEFRQLINPFKQWQRCSMGNRSNRENFFFVGVVPLSN